MNKPAFQLKPLGAALRLKTTQKKQVSTIQRIPTSNFTTASPTSPLNAPSSHHNPPHTPVRTSCNPAVKRTRLRIAASASQWLGGCCSAPTGLQRHRRCAVLPQQKRSGPDLQQWTRNSTIATDVGTEEVLTAGMQQWHDVSQTVAPRSPWNRKYLLLLELSTDRLSMRAWISFSTPTDQSRIWMSPLLLLSLAIRPWSQQPAQDQDSRPKELRRTNSTVTHTATSFLLSSRTQVDLVHTPENSSATSCETLTTLHKPSETPGQLSKVCSTVPSPNNSSQPLLRDL